MALTGTVVSTGTGNAGDNILTGNQNTGANMLVGLGGDDIYCVDGSDIVVEQADGGQDTVIADSTYTLSKTCFCPALR